jgi:PqqD family protein of HPr-rel-A system
MNKETVNMNTSVVTWRIANDAQLRLRYWDDECVLYHGASGDTHRLTDLVGYMLEQLLQKPASIPELAAAINLHEEDVKTALNELSRLGITETSA